MNTQPQEQLASTNRRRRSRVGGRRQDRKGAAVVELAVILPVLLTLLFGTIEVCQRLHVKQSVVIAAYEGCRVATRQTSDTATVQASVETSLTQHGVTWKNIQVRDMTRGQNNLDDIETGDEIRVRVVTEWSPNTISRHVVEDQGQFIIDAVMLRE